MALTMDVFPGGSGVEGTKQKLAAAAKQKSTGHVYDRIFVRHWDAWNDGRRSHLFVMPVTGKGDPADVMPNMDADTPSRPFGSPTSSPSRPTAGSWSSPHATWDAKSLGPRISTFIVCPSMRPLRPCV